LLFKNETAMKRLLRIFIFLIIICGVVYTAYRYFLSGKSSFQSIYLVPSNAVIMVETDAVFDAWDKIIHSKSWKTVSHIEALAELDKEIRSLDSLISEKLFLFRLLDRRKVLMSVHEYVPGRFGYLYSINIGKISRLRNPEKLIGSLLGKDYPVTKRIYAGQTIYEMLDRSSGDMYIFSFLHDKLIFSTNYLLLEASVKETEKMTIGRNLHFIEISKRISGKGLFSIYIQYQYLPSYLQYIMGNTPENMQKIDEELTFSGASFSLDADGMISLEGYTGVNNEVYSIYTTVLEAGNGGMKSMEVIPAEIASMVKISISDPTVYFNNSLKQLNPQEYEKYMETMRKLEKKFRINTREHILSWIDDEIVLLQTKPSNLGSKNEFAAIIKSKGKKAAENNLGYIVKQIRKNAPVKFKTVVYEGFTINYLSFPGLIKLLFGRMLSKIERPYYTQIEEFVIFSNHPQTLKNIIDDYKKGNTLAGSPGFNDFSKQFSRRSSAFCYADIPVFYNNLQHFTGAEAWRKLEKNKRYINHFPRAGIEMENKDELLHLTIKALYSDTAGSFSRIRYDGDDFLQLFSVETSENEAIPLEEWYNPDVIIKDLDAKKAQMLYDEGTLKYEVELRNGMKHGSFREYFRNGKLKISGRFRNDIPDGTWKLYDENGTLLMERELKNGEEISE